MVLVPEVLCAGEISNVFAGLKITICCIDTVRLDSHIHGACRGRSRHPGFGEIYLRIDPETTNESARNIYMPVDLI